TGLHLLHRPAAMHLHRGFGDADVVRDLLAEAPACDLDDDLALPGAQRFEALPQRRQVLFILPSCTIARQADLNGIEEVLIAERLGQELDGPSFHRLHRHRDVAVTGDEDDRDLPVCSGELTLEIEAALAGQSDVEYKAVGAIRRIGPKKLGDGSE